MATIHLPPDFKDFLRLLNENGVEYLLIGGYAVGYYGFPRATADMDIWIAISPANAVSVTEALQAFGFDVPDLKPSLFLEKKSQRPSQGPQRSGKSAVTMPKKGM